MDKKTETFKEREESQMFTKSDLRDAFLACYWLHLDSDNNDLATRKDKFENVFYKGLIQRKKQYSESFKSSLREEIEKKKQRSIRQTTRSDFDLGYEAALNEVLKELDITPKQ